MATLVGNRGVRRTEARLVDRGETMARTRQHKLSRWCRQVVYQCAESAMEVADDAVSAAMNEQENQLRHELDAAGLLEQMPLAFGSSSAGKDDGEAWDVDPEAQRREQREREARARSKRSRRNKQNRRNKKAASTAAVAASATAAAAVEEKRGEIGVNAAVLEEEAAGGNGDGAAAPAGVVPYADMECVAFYEGDYLWYSAKVVEVAVDGQTCTVIFTGYGHSQQVPVTWVQPAPVAAVASEDDSGGGGGSVSRGGGGGTEAGSDGGVSSTNPWSSCTNVTAAGSDSDSASGSECESESDDSGAGEGVAEGIKAAVAEAEADTSSSTAKERASEFIGGLSPADIALTMNAFKAVLEGGSVGEYGGCGGNGGGGGANNVDATSKGKKKQRKRPRQGVGAWGGSDAPNPFFPHVHDKYWAQRFRLFSLYDRGIQLDTESWYSVTPERISQHIAERCRCDVIVDAFCGTGGNVIQFAKTCHRVIAIDIDPLKIAMAKHNARIYGVEERIEFICGDSLSILPTIKADIVFLSPPWGGPEYLDAPEFDIGTMFVGKMEGVGLFELASKACPNVAYFLPRTTKVDQLAQLGATHRRMHGSGGGGDGHEGSEVEVEDHYLNSKLKTLIAYYGRMFASM